MPHWLPFAASFALALIPVVIWLKLLPQGIEGRMIYIKTFLIGTLSVVPPFILIFLFRWFPQFNIYSFINRSVAQVALNALITNIVVGIIEEIGKHMIVRVVDKRHPEYLQTISSALKLSICSGLGFAFAENIFYFYNVWTNPRYGAADLFATLVFRSIFTACGHMVFSGTFGYYFGIGKFASDFTEKARWEGKHMYLTHFLSRITGRMPFQVMREQKNMTGLFFAMGMHASYNALLDRGYKLPAIAIVLIAAAYIAYLMFRKTGHMLFSITKRRASSMAPRDEEVVMELLGMLTKEGKLREVMEICDRLLERDPDNNVVKLFRAKAGDNQKLRDVYGALKTVLKKTPVISQIPTNIIAAPTNASTPTATLTPDQEKVILEVMNMWFQGGNYNKVLEISNKLLARNPQSQGAQVLMQKAFDKEKMQKVFDALGKLFEE